MPIRGAGIAQVLARRNPADIVQMTAAELSPSAGRGSGRPSFFFKVATGNRRAEQSHVVTRPSTTLADLLTPLLVANPFSAMRTSLRWWSSDEFEDGVAHGW